MLTKVPAFSLRHFMAHLAPGAYCALQAAFMLAVAVWFFSPKLIGAIGCLQPPGTAMTALFSFFLITICYFIGVVIRLRPVAPLDEDSVNYNLRRLLLDQSSSYCRARFPWRAFLIWAIPSALLRRYLGSQKITCRQAVALLAQQEGNDKIADEPRNLPENNDTPFGDWVRKQAVEAIGEYDNIHEDEIDGQTVWRERWRWLSRWIWHADQFPYPLWRIFSTYLIGAQKDVIAFRRILRPELDEAMGGRVSDARPNHHAFNRSKLWILHTSPDIAATVYDTEALVRMVNGFFEPIRWASRMSFWMIVLFWPLVPVRCMMHTDVALTSCPISSGQVFLGLVLLLLGNWLLSTRVVHYFNHLRRMESTTLFDALIVLRSAPDTVKNGTVSAECQLPVIL